MVGRLAVSLRSRACVVLSLNLDLLLRLQPQMATAPNGHSPKWPQPQMAKAPQMAPAPNWLHMSARNHLSHSMPTVWGGMKATECCLERDTPPNLVRSCKNLKYCKNLVNFV